MLRDSNMRYRPLPGSLYILHERRMTMFNVRIKNSKLIYTVYAIDESDTGDLIFLVFDTVDQMWFWELANNCVPA